jgi:hypothetical protein
MLWGVNQWRGVDAARICVQQLHQLEVFNERGHVEGEPRRWSSIGIQQAQTLILVLPPERLQSRPLHHYTGRAQKYSTKGNRRVIAALGESGTLSSIPAGLWGPQCGRIRAVKRSFLFILPVVCQRVAFTFWSMTRGCSLPNRVYGF